MVTYYSITILGTGAKWIATLEDRDTQPGKVFVLVFNYPPKIIRPHAELYEYSNVELYKYSNRVFYIIISAAGMASF